VNSTGIILAAGASSRMGRPKALLIYNGETFLDRLNGIFTRVTSNVPLAVLGYHADVIRDGASRPFRAVVNPQPALGQLSSLQCALRELQDDCEVFLFTPVDNPAFAEATVTSLLSVLQSQPGAMLAIPRYKGRRGHPVACRAALAGEFLALAAGAQAREVVHAHRDRTVYIDTDDPGIRHDVDDPAAYQRLLDSAPGARP
jgi:CTP:molybdopterin cytidylyltransferase MocA